MKTMLDKRLLEQARKDLIENFGMCLDGEGHKFRDFEVIDRWKEGFWIWKDEFVKIKCDECGFMKEGKEDELKSELRTYQGVIRKAKMFQGLR